MRYIAKFTNGYWKTFDSQTYLEVSIHLLKTEAEANAERLNTRLKKA